MSEERSRGRQWNLFARELQALLAARGFGLGHLDDRAHIHREKVRRLQRSLREPKFHVLSPDELDYVCEVFAFTHQERIRLRAAVLCTAIEELLMDRINQDDALAATEQLFPLLCQSLALHDGEEAGVGAIKAGVSALDAPNSVPTDCEGADEEAVAEVESALEYALGHLDSALLALHLSHGMKTTEAQARYAHQALNRSMVALAALEQAGLPGKRSSSWRTWHAEVLTTVAAAERRLATVGP